MNGKTKGLQEIELQLQQLLEEKMRIQQEARDIIHDPMVVYQGEPGAYSEMATRNFFGENVRTKGLYQFEDTFQALKNGTADYAVLPIENSSTGAIRQVYDLLIQYECYMVGETTVTIEHNLMALPGTKLEEIEAVYSHEQGIFQCEQFLNEHMNWKRIPAADTAGSAKMVAELGDKRKAAICSARAAELYGLEILVPSVQTNKLNTTRFVVVSPRMELREQRDKICLSFTVRHESGTLHHVLTIFANHDLNLVRIESRPIQKRNWEYMFFVELTGNLTDPGMEDIMLSVSRITSEFRIFGNFKANLEYL